MTTQNIKIEVSAVRESDAFGFSTCNADPANAMAFAVYIRAPEALHVDDFPAHKYLCETHAERLSMARSAAFAFADRLAEHIGATVESELSRTAEFDASLAAMCLWEHVLELKGEESDAGRACQLAFDGDGYCALRDRVSQWAGPIEADYSTSDFDDSFDWEFVPAWVALNIDWSEGGRLRDVRSIPGSPAPATQAPSDAETVQHDALLALGFATECMGGGNEALTYYRNGWCVMITASDGGTLPGIDDWGVGIYRAENAGCGPIFYISKQPAETEEFSLIEAATAAIGGTLGRLGSLRA